MADAQDTANRWPIPISIMLATTCIPMLLPMRAPKRPAGGELFHAAAE
jgi:hypothetical protein